MYISITQPACLEEARELQRQLPYSVGHSDLLNNYRWY